MSRLSILRRTALALAALLAATLPGIGPAAADFTSDQQVLLQRISGYFNAITTLQGQFVQIGPNGEQAEGSFALARPGKVRFHYFPPTRLDVVADGSSVSVEDRNAMTQDIYPLNKTPLRWLLADNVDLTSSQLVRDVIQEPDLTSLVLTDESLGGSLTLIFDSTSLELRQWIATDSQGLDTSVAIYNVAAGQPVDNGQFRISMDPDLR